MKIHVAKVALTGNGQSSTLFLGMATEERSVLFTKCTGGATLTLESSADGTNWVPTILTGFGFDIMGTGNTCTPYHKVTQSGAGTVTLWYVYYA